MGKKLTDASITQVTTLTDGSLFYSADTSRAVGDKDVSISKSDLDKQFNPLLTDWNATTNTPTLSNSDTIEKDTQYKVSVAGSVNFGAGSITFGIGDIISNDGSIWYKKSR